MTDEIARALKSYAAMLRRHDDIALGHPADIMDEAHEALQAANSVLELILEGYPRIDVSHEEFRVTVYKAALDALKIKSPLLSALENDCFDRDGYGSGSDGW